MVQKLTLTVEQARELQRGDEFPGKWAALWNLDLPDEPNSTKDLPRLMVAVALHEAGWCEKQIVAALMWKPNSVPVNTFRGLVRVKPTKAKSSKATKALKKKP